MTTLNDNTVLVSGGQNGNVHRGGEISLTYTSCELFNLATGTFNATGAMNIARYGHRAALLPSGRVLVAGGSVYVSFPTSTAEITDPTTRRWSFAATMPVPRFNFEMQRLPSGLIFVGGGVTSAGYATDTLFYNENTNTWTPGTSLLFTNQNDYYAPTSVLYRH